MENIISKEATILDALKKINSLSSDSALTLLITDEDNRLCGTLTDGDIRRSIVKGANIQTLAIDVAQRKFKYIKEKNYSVTDIHRAKEMSISLLPILNDQMQIVDVINLKKRKSHLPIDAVLMAGGKGERLRPLTEKTPKPLLKVGDKCIIDYNIDNLIAYGVKHLNVTINYLGEQIEEHFAEPRDGVQVRTFREPKFLGTMGSIKFVDALYNDTVLIMNSDLFTNIDYEDFYLHFQHHGADMSVATVPYNVSIPFGIFELNGRNIQGIKEKPSYHYYANAGIYLIKKDILKYIPEKTFFNATDLIEVLVNLRMNVIRFPITGYWIDIGQHSELDKARELINYMKVL